MIKYIKYNLTLLFVSLMLFSNISSLGQWLPDSRLTNDTAQSNGGYSFNKWIAASGNKLHIIWIDKRTGYDEVFYKRSTNNGITWSNEIKISNSNSDVDNLCISATDAKVHVTWDQLDGNTYNIYYNKSTNSGLTFGNNTRLTSGTESAAIPSISSSGSNIYLAWNDMRDGNSEIYFKKSNDNGLTWSNDIRLTNHPSISQHPCIQHNGQNIHIIWGDNRNNQFNYDTYYKRSTDGGNTWSPDLLIANSYGISNMSVSGNSINVVWMVQQNGFDVFYRNSTNGGNTWNSEMNLSNNTFTPSSSPSILAIGSVVHCVWFDDTTGIRQLFYKRSTNNGFSWDGNVVLTQNSVLAENPSLASTYSGLHVVWNDSRDGNKEIYYKQNPTCNGPYTVSGTVTFKDNNQPVTGGYVKALKYDSETAEIVAVDSTVINSNGTYMLSHMPSEELDLMYYQDDDLLHFVPTYYVSTIDWREATPIYATQNLTNINCQVYRINNTSNPFNISGQVTANLDNSSVTSMKDAIIYAKSSGTFRNYGITNGNGSYITTKLPAGSYELITHRMGFAPVSQNVTITNSSLSNINFDMGSPLIGINTINENIPSKYLLNQNYPNPFNPATTIKFSVPVAGHIKLSVYDILGREIEVLANKNISAGSYSVIWDASNYTSGIYFYRLEGSDFTETKKMVLIK
jgi:hypothetical protein